jgi:PP-loop superfamily ATP-utilizing enzyme
MAELKIIEKYIGGLKKNPDGKITVLFSGGIDSWLVVRLIQSISNKY